MANQPPQFNPGTHDEFVQQAQGRSGGLLREYLDLLRYNKKWWLTPIIISLILVGAVVVLGGTALAPFIYALF